MFALFPAPTMTDQHLRLIVVYSSMLGDIRLWVGPRKEHLLSSWELKKEKRHVNATAGGGGGGSHEVRSSVSVTRPCGGPRGAGGF